MLKYKNLNLVYITISFLLFFFYGKQIISAINNSDDYSQPIFRLIIFFLWILNLVFIFINLRGIINISSPILNVFKILFFLMLLILVSLSDATQTFGTNLFRVLGLLLPFLTFIGFYGVFRRGDYKQLLPRLFVPLLLWLVYVYYTQYNIIIASLEVEDQAYNSAYVLLFTLPLLLCLDKKWLRISAIIIIAAVVLSSNKRGGFVAYSLAILVYLLVYGAITKKKISLMKRVGIVLVILLSVWKLYDFVETAKDNFFLYRLEKLQNDGGSGRIGIYMQVIDGIGNANFVEFVLGHGDNQVVNLTKEGLSSHNDFLEVLYCYGILIFLVYLSLHYLLIKKVLFLIKTKNRYAAPMAASVVIFFVFSFISHVIIYYYFIFLVVFWGMVLGSIDREKIATYKSRQLNNLSKINI